MNRFTYLPMCFDFPDIEPTSSYPIYYLLGLSDRVYFLSILHHLQNVHHHSGTQSPDFAKAFS